MRTWLSSWNGAIHTYHACCMEAVQNNVWTVPIAVMHRFFAALLMKVSRQKW